MKDKRRVRRKKKQGRGEVTFPASREQKREGGGAGEEGICFAEERSRISWKQTKERQGRRDGGGGELEAPEVNPSTAVTAGNKRVDDSPLPLVRRETRRESPQEREGEGK